jgi:hypothetical protein
MHPFETESKIANTGRMVTAAIKLMLADWDLYCEVKTLFPVSPAEPGTGL